MKPQLSNKPESGFPKLPALTILAGAALVVISACSSRSASDPPAQVPPPVGVQPGPHSPWQGYYHGSASIGGAEVEMDALVMPDRQVRVRFGEASDDFGFVRASFQFAGTFTEYETGISSAGIVVGQGCARADAGAECGTAVPAVLNLVADGKFGSNPGRDRLVGTLELSGASGPETWDITTGWIDQAYQSNPTSHYLGQYLARPWTAVTSTATLLSIDAAGGIFLQSPVSGCVANGVIAADSRVSMTIDNCAGEFGYLNGEYAGLMSGFCVDPWEYGCYGLSLWLSAQYAAVTITADWLDQDP